MTGLTSWAKGPDFEPFAVRNFFTGEKKPAITGRFFMLRFQRRN